MTLQEFINKWDGKPADYDKAYGNQCMDIFHYYEMEVWGIAPKDLVRAATAYKAFIKGSDKYDRFYYKPGIVPEPGDVIFWNDTYVKNTGHVAIYVRGDENGFTSFDQNWPVGSLCHLQKHNYDGVAGWFRLNTLTKEEMKQLDDHEKAISAIFNRLDAIETLQGDTKLVKMVKKLKERKIAKKSFNDLFKKKTKKK